jgi:hypothetical protein
MTSLASLQPRERRLALIAAVLIGCWVLLGWLIQPLWERVQTLHAQVASQHQKLDGIVRLLERAPAIERRFQATAGYLEPGDDEQAQSAFLNELESLSRTASVRLNLKPRPTSLDGRVGRFEVELDAEGSQAKLLGFLDALFRMPKLLTIERMRIATVPAKQDLLRATLVLQKLSVRE